MGIDKQAFRQALGQFATGVCVITTVDQHKAAVGVTASSFNSVSMEPPLILWSIDRSAYSSQIFATAEYFCVNILGSEQAAVSNHFASRGTDKFSTVQWTQVLGGCPRIAHAVADFQCRTWNVHDGGDHLIIIGEVIEFNSESAAESLVFYKGAYANAVPQATPAATTDSAEDDGFVGNYLLYLLRQAHTRYSQDFYPRLSRFGISVPEWRVLTVVADLQNPSEEQILPRVGQPPAELALTCQALQSKQLLIRSGANWSLSDQGQALCARLVEMGRSHEAQILQRLSEQLAQQSAQGGQRAAEPIKQQLHALLSAI